MRQDIAATGTAGHHASYLYMFTAMLKGWKDKSFSFRWMVYSTVTAQSHMYMCVRACVHEQNMVEFMYFKYLYFQKEFAFQAYCPWDISFQRKHISTSLMLMGKSADDFEWLNQAKTHSWSLELHGITVQQLGLINCSRRLNVSQVGIVSGPTNMEVMRN